ncbi:MAG TPA: type II secretion system F family protein [Acidothermaceae bacterium]|nr:type II secretion system F family protein [Acidothermaceae bacterium]
MRTAWARRLAAFALGFVAAGAFSSTAVAASSASAPPASSAAPSSGTTAASGRIVQLTTDPGSIQVLFSAVGLPNGESIDPTSVRLSADGVPISATATAVGATPPPQVVRTAMLVVDISGSMQGAGIDGAKAAANTFLDAVPSDVKVGLVTVSTTATLVAAPTTDRAALRAKVSALQATGNTALYDGTLLALHTLGDVGSRTIVLLTDGHDEGSQATLAQVVAAEKASNGAVLDAVSFGTASAQVEPLQQLTAAAGGRVISTTKAGDFAPAFRQAAKDIATEVLITGKVPASLAGKSVTIQVTATAGGRSISDTAFTPLAKPAPASPSAAAVGPRPVAIHPSNLGSSSTFRLGLVALFCGLVGILGVAAWNASTVDARDTRVRRRLSFYTLTGRGSRKEPQTTALGDSSVARSAVQLAGRLVVSRDFDAKLGRRLDGAGVPLKPAEWIVIQAGSAVGLALIFLLLSGGSPVAAVLGVIVGVGGPIGYLVIKESRRSTAFLEQLPDTLQLIAGSLSVGHSLVQAMDAVVREELAPVSIEFNRALVETRLGVPPEDALEGIAARMDSQDFAWVVMAIRIQREVGGNLAEVLTTVAGTIRERERLRRQVRGLSAEGRLSAWILGALPPVFGTYLVLVRPNYIKPLFTDPLGIVMLVVLLVTMTAGVVWLSRIVKVQV